MNSVSLTGNIGKAPEIRMTNTGKKVANFDLAVKDGYGEKERTHWIRITLWENKAEFVEKYLSSGSKVGVTGKLIQRTWETSDGQKRYAVEVEAFSIESLESLAQRQEREQQTQPYQSRDYKQDPEPTFDEDEPVLDITSDDLPF